MISKKKSGNWMLKNVQLRREVEVDLQMLQGQGRKLLLLRELNVLLDRRKREEDSLLTNVIKMKMLTVMSHLNQT